MGKLKLEIFVHIIIKGTNLYKTKRLLNHQL